VPKSIRKPASKAFLDAKNNILGLYNNVKEKLGLKGEVEEQAMKEHNEEEGEGITQHKQAMNGAYKSFRVASQNKADVDSYMTLVKHKVRRLIAEQVKTLKSAKVQMHLWVQWKSQLKCLLN